MAQWSLLERSDRQHMFLPSSICHHGLTIALSPGIKLCGMKQTLGHAICLVAEMKTREIPCNIHTLSALMNTCIKCAQYNVALDVFHKIQVGVPQSHVLCQLLVQDRRGWMTFKFLLNTWFRLSSDSTWPVTAIPQFGMNLV